MLSQVTGLLDRLIIKRVIWDIRGQDIRGI